MSTYASSTGVYIKGLLIQLVINNTGMFPLIWCETGSQEVEGIPLLGHFLQIVSVRDVMSRSQSYLFVEQWKWSVPVKRVECDLNISDYISRCSQGSTWVLSPIMDGARTTNPQLKWVLKWMQLTIMNQMQNSPHFHISPAVSLKVEQHSHIVLAGLLWMSSFHSLLCSFVVNSSATSLSFNPF